MTEQSTQKSASSLGIKNKPVAVAAVIGNWSRSATPAMANASMIRFRVNLGVSIIGAQVSTQSEVCAIEENCQTNQLGDRAASTARCRRKNLYEQARPAIQTAMFGKLSCFLAWVLAGSNAFAASTVNWPQFRGPQASGVSDDPAPITWNVESGENVRWQTPIPGLGHACPIVWQDRVYVATAVKPGGKARLKVGLYGDVDAYTEKEPQQWRLLCLNKTTGKVLWDKLALESVPRLPRHTKAS